MLDKAVHKSALLYACLINRETIKLKTSYIISNQVRNKLQIIDCLRFVLASFQDRKLSFVIPGVVQIVRTQSERLER